MAVVPTAEVGFKRLEHGKGLDQPSYETGQSAGMDLPAAVPEGEPLSLEPGQRALVPTGFAIALAPGYEAQIRPRSGLAAKHGVTILNTPGTIDADYRGEVKVILANLGDQTFIVERAMRIAQMVVAPVTRAVLVERHQLDDTYRGAGGFGSTGLKSNGGGGT
jgi:dUTP pyrophosphatase